MSNNPTVAKIGESGLVFAKDKTTNQVTTIATTADMQIGLPNQSANLSLTGAIGLSTLDITIAEGSTRSIPDSLTNINVTTTGASGTATLRLPAAPKKGQLVYIKDAGGNAGTVSITVVGSPEGTKTNRGTTSHLIDGSTSKTITANYGILQLLWNSSSWSVISSTASSAPLDASYVVIGSNATLTNERILTAGPGVSIVDGGAGSTITISASGVGTGDVIGPASAADNAIARFDLTTGKVIQNSGVTISDSNDIITPGDVAINGGDLTSTATTFNLLNSTVTTLNVGGAATTATVGASTADVVVGRAEIGAWPAGTSYAFFGNSDYNHSVAGNYALIQASSAGTKNTWLNAPTGGKVYIANNDAALGYLDDNEISLTGKASTAQTITLGSMYSNSSTTIQAGTGDIDLNSSGSVNLNPSNDAFINFMSNGVDLGSMGYSTFFGGFSTINLTGVSTDDTFLTLGNSYGGSATSIYAGTGGILLSGSTTIISSSLDVAYYSFSRADARLGNAEVGSWPWGNFNDHASHFAMFGNEVLDHSIISNYALLQDKLGYTYLNAASGKSLHLRSNNTDYAAINPAEGGSPTDKVVIYKVLSASGGTTAYTDAVLGNASVGSWPGYEGGAFKEWYAIFGHKTLDHTTTTLKAGLAQLYTGDTYLNSPAGNKVYLSNNGNAIGYFDDNEISLTGKANVDQTITLGSNYGGSYTRIDGGFLGVFISGSLITLTGSSANASLSADARIGSVEIGGLPGYGNSVAMFGHTDLNHAYNNDTSEGMGNYALGQSNDGSTYINSPQNKGIYFLTSGASGLPLGRIYFKTSTLSSELILTGASYFNSNVFLGSSYGQSSTSIYAGTGGIILSGSGASIIITGSTSTQADAYIGSVEVGTHPFWGGNYAMFSHKDMDNSADGNAALIQAYDGDTFLGAKSTKSIFIKNGTSFIGKFDNDNIELTGDTSTSTATILGNSYGLSSTKMYAGLFGITLSGSATTTITGSSSTNAEAYIGTAEVGELPYTRTSFPNYFAMFGHKTLDHSSNGNYALVQSYDGDTFLNSANSKSIYLQNAGNQIGILDNDNISLTGQANTSVATEIGSVYGLSSTTIKGGLFGLILTGSGTTITITGSTTSQADAYIGSAEIGVHPFWGRNYAMFSHKDMDNSVDGNSALIQAYDGDTFLGAKSTKSIFIKNGTSFIGKFDNDNIELTGDTSTSTATILGNSYGVSYTNIYSGLFGITLSGSATTTITGSSSGNADAYIGSAEVGVHPYWGRNYAMFGHKDLNNSSDGNAALIQSNVGDTFLGAVNNNYLYFKNGTRSLGYFQYSTFFGKTIFSLDGAAGSPASVTIGNSESSSNLTLNAGSGSIDIGSTPQSRSTNIATGAAVQTVTLGSSNSSSTLTLDAGSGGVNIGTNPGGSSKTINIGTTTGINTDINVGSEYLASTTVIKAGGPFASLGGMYLTGSTVTTYTVGGETGTGTINIGRSTASNTINVGAAGNNASNTQTINVGNGTGKSVVTIGSQSGVSSLTLDAGGGNIDIGTSATARSINVGTGAANQTISIGNNSIANQVTIYGGTPFVGVGGIYLTGSAGTPYIIGGETGTGTISLGRSTASNTINIGNATTTSGNTQTINIASSASGTGLAAITIGNTNGASSLTLNAGTGYTTINGHEIIARTALVAYPSDAVTDYPLQLNVVTGGNTVRWAIGADTGDDLNFSYSLNSTTVASRGYLSNGADVTAIDFTGQHRNYPVGGNVLDFSDKIGLIVASVGQYKSLTSGSAEISINEALPLVELSTKRNQKSVFGVISDHEDPNETSRDYVTGNWGSVYEKMQNDDRLIVNSLGEGAIWICNINGNLQNGDYITSCEVPGYGMKQDDDILHNYTAAKITCDCDFFLDSTVYRCEEFQHEGKTYRRAFVGCTYHCG